MKLFVKLGLLGTALMSVASSAFAGLSGQNFGGSEVIRSVPEPAALGLLAVGVVVLALVKRKK